MAATLTTTDIGTSTGWESRRSPRASELWSVAGGGSGSADGDTGTITTRMNKPQAVIGAVSYSISGNTVTVTSITALAAGETLAVEVIGYV